MNKAEQIEEMANMIWAKGPLEAAADLYAAGYRKVEKMPVLTLEVFEAILREGFVKEQTWHEMFKELGVRIHRALTAQRDADYRFLMEEK